MIKKHGRYYWLDIRIQGKRGLALEKARDIKNELIAIAEKKDISIHEFTLKYLSWAWDSKSASAGRSWVS